MLAGLFDGSDDVWRSARGGNAYYGVFVVDIKFFEVVPALQGVVLGIFDRVSQGRISSGD